MTIPDTASDHAIIRFRYQSNNPFEIYPADNTDAIFYNCADIKIIANTAIPNRFLAPTPVADTQSPSTPVVDTAATSCTIPPSVELLGTEINFYLGPIQHHVYYDATKRLLRWDKFGRIEPTDTEPISLTYLTNYTLPNGPFPAYVINKAT